MRSATPRSALAAAHEQPYGRTVDEQGEHSGRRKQERESARVGQLLVIGDGVVHHVVLGRGGCAIGSGRGAIGRGGRTRGGASRRAVRTTGGRAINTCGTTRGLAMVDLRQAEEDLVDGYVADLLGDLRGRIFDL